MSLSDTDPGTLSSLILVPHSVNELLRHPLGEGIDRSNDDLHDVVDLMTISSRLDPKHQGLHTLLGVIKAAVPDTGDTDATEASPQMSRLPVAVTSLLPSALTAIEETANKLGASDPQALEIAWRVRHDRRVAKHGSAVTLALERLAADDAQGDPLGFEAPSNTLRTSREASTLPGMVLDLARRLTVGELTALLETYIGPDVVGRLQAYTRASATETLLPNITLLKQRIEEATRKSGGHQTAAYVNYWSAESSRAEQIFQEWLALEQAGSRAEQMEIDDDPMEMDGGGEEQKLEAGTSTVSGAPGRGLKRSATLLSGDGEGAADDDASSVKILRLS